MCDEPSTNKLTNESSQVRCQCLHAVAQVVSKVLSVLCKINLDDVRSQYMSHMQFVLQSSYNLLGQGGRRLEVLVGDFRAHGDLSSGFNRLLDLLREDIRKVSFPSIGTEAHLQDDTRVGEVVVEDLCEFWEVPRIVSRDESYFKFEC